MDHAVVLGAGMSGLCAARALARHAARVTLVEQDPLPDDRTPRRGVPQGRHVHALLGGGGQSLERLFPGLGDELTAAGAVRSVLLAESGYLLGGGELARGDADAVALQATRPLLEQAVRDRVTKLDGVRILERHEALEPVWDRGDRVAGVRVRERAGHARPEVLEASLVVDALGRSGRCARWYARAGYPAPPEERTPIDVGYATRFLRFPDGGPRGDKTLLTGNIPGHPGRGCGLLSQEGGRWILTLAGMCGDHPPTDEDGFQDFARTAMPDWLYAAVRAAEPLSDPVFHRFPYSLRRRYEKLRAHPRGLLAIGDSVCSFNPVYGQGMSVAAREAEALDACLLEGPSDLARRYFTAAARVIGPAWNMAKGADLAVPHVPGKRPLAGRLLNRYTQRYLDAACRDPELAARYVRVIGLLDPPGSLLAPRAARRVLLGGRG